MHAITFAQHSCGKRIEICVKCQSLEVVISSGITRSGVFEEMAV